ncbi:hypothetical protein AM1_4797 [Acaryochloris marina MBIC11017]|uniref:Uncharacterized protein n=1 Tax=Acaryochloris marina (strain MBIC 11017) TaxID=329726 RepID=B0C2H8_ACAM1|nr:hypothetical protein AM1_4797 [Acaryochloris marina MBIC11017]
MHMGNYLQLLVTKKYHQRLINIFLGEFSGDFDWVNLSIKLN